MISSGFNGRFSLLKQCCTTSLTKLPTLSQKKKNIIRRGRRLLTLPQPDVMWPIIITSDMELFKQEFGDIWFLISANGLISNLSQMRTNKVWWNTEGQLGPGLKFVNDIQDQVVYDQNKNLNIDIWENKMGYTTLRWMKSDKLTVNIYMLCCFCQVQKWRMG